MKALQAGTLLFFSWFFGCTHSPDILREAQLRFEDREFGRALPGFRKVSAKECEKGEGAMCCAALLGEADSLAGMDERHNAVASYRRARTQCPFDVTVRRKLFLAEHAGDPEVSTAPASVSFQIDHRFVGLGPRVRLVWLGLFLDGETIGRGPIAVHAGNHEVEVEAFLEIIATKENPARQLRLRAVRPVVVSAVGPSSVLGGVIQLLFAETLREPVVEARYRLELTVSPLGPESAMKMETPKTAAPMLEQHLGMNLRETGDRPKIPRALLKAGPGWTALSELCVNPEGRVESIRFLRPSPVHDPVVDAAIVDALRRWRYGRYVLNGVPQPFCHSLLVDLGDTP